MLRSDCVCIVVVVAVCCCLLWIASCGIEGNSVKLKCASEIKLNRSVLSAYESLTAAHLWKIAEPLLFLTGHI